MIEMVEVAVAAIVAGAGVLGAVVGHLFGRRKKRAESDFSTVQAAESVVRLYGQALKDIEEKVKALEKEIACLRAENLELRLQLAAQNGGKS